MPKRSVLVVSLALATVTADAVVPAPAEAAVRRPFAPRLGAVVALPPLLSWRPVRGAAFYNVQLYRGGRKVLSRWPARSRLRLHRAWRHGRYVFKLRPAVYHWFVWHHDGRRYGRLRVRGRFTFGRRPRSVAPPLVTGSPREGKPVAASPGIWTGLPRPRLRYQWRRCESDGAACVPIARATFRTYEVVSDDIDRALQVVVTASNIAGTAVARSHVTDRALPAPPRNVSSPGLVGGPQHGEVLVGVNGSWTSSRPVSYAFRWERCDPGGRSCRRIAGANRQAYRLQEADVGRRVRVGVIAANAGGSTLAISRTTSVVGRSLHGSPRADVIRGTHGADVIHAGAGADLVRGGLGGDLVFGGPGADHLFGGPGDDVIVARRGGFDAVVCGPGRDRVTSDRRDRVHRSCELVNRR